LYTIAQQHRITIAMASLTSLPTELMGFVVEHLSLEDKVNLVKTCRTTHVAVLPAVYHTVILDTRPTDRKKPPAGTVVGLKRINGLRFTIATRPHLAKHVRRLEAYNYSSTFAGVDFSLEERRAYSQLIDTTCPPMRKHWKKTYTSTRNSILVLVTSATSVCSSRKTVHLQLCTSNWGLASATTTTHSIRPTLDDIA
jgi:hypothetical protein